MEFGFLAMLFATNLMLSALVFGLHGISSRIERANILKEADLRARGVEIPASTD